jgi:hypothetical protein
MAAKDVRLRTDARERMLRGIDTLTDAVRVTLGPKGRNVVIRMDVGATSGQHAASGGREPIALPRCGIADLLSDVAGATGTAHCGLRRSYPPQGVGSTSRY